MPKGRPPQAFCKHGHSLDDAYVIQRTDGSSYRRCRTCSLEASKAYSKRTYVATPRPEPSMPSDPIVLAYAAGLFDGEGSVIIRLHRKRGDATARYHAIDVSLTSTDSETIAWLVEHFGGSTSAHPAQNERQKDAQKWQLRSRHAEAFLRAARPYLIAKARQADVGLELRALTGSGRATPVTDEMFARREGLRAQLRALNRRGR